MALQPWTIPCLWPGETAVIIGGGPSLTQEQVDACRGRARVIAVNDAYRLAPWCDWLHGCDMKWWVWHRETALSLPAIKTTLCDTVPAAWGVRLLRNTGVTGFDADPASVRTGKNGVYQAIHAAVHAGARRIALIGVDMKRAANGTSHWFGEHPSGPVPDYKTVMIPHFDSLVEPLRDRGVEVFNCTPGSALETFPKRDLSEVL